MKILEYLPENELKQITFFKIYNEYGTITFLDPTDLTYVNFDKDVSIEEFEVIYLNFQNNFN